MSFEPWLCPDSGMNRGGIVNILTPLSAAVRALAARVGEVCLGSRSRHCARRAKPLAPLPVKATPSALQGSQHPPAARTLAPGESAALTAAVAHAAAREEHGAAISAQTLPRPPRRPLRWEPNRPQPRRTVTDRIVRAPGCTRQRPQ